MTTFTKPSTINNLWAASGDRTDVPTAKRSAGWVAEKPSFQYFNSELNKYGQSLAYLNQRGVSGWDEDTEYQALVSRTVDSNGVFHRCLTTHTNENPVSDDGTNWYTNVYDNLLGEYEDLTGQVFVGQGISYAGSLYRVEVGIANITSEIPARSNSNFSVVSEYGSVTYAISQLAGGDADKVAIISSGVVIGSEDWFVYPNQGRIYETGGATGTFSGDFDPDTGIDSGISGTLSEYGVGNEIEKIENGLYKRVTVNITTNLTLTDTQNQYGRIKLTDTGGELAGSVILTVGSEERELYVINDTIYDIKVETASGTGVHVTSGKSFSLYCDGSNIETLGVANEVVLQSLGEYGVGSNFTYPNGMDVSYLNSITIDITTSTSNLTTISSNSAGEERLEAYPSTWIIDNRFSTATTDRSLTVSATSTTEFEVSASNNIGRMGGAYATLKEGVTY